MSVLGNSSHSADLDVSYRVLFFGRQGCETNLDEEGGQSSVREIPSKQGQILVSCLGYGPAGLAQGRSIHENRERKQLVV
jgi:hypothetical protein